MSGSGRKTLKDVREMSGCPPGWSGSPFECLGMVGRPFWMSGIGWEALPDVQEWSGGPSGCP